MSILDLFPAKVRVRIKPSRFVPQTPCWDWVNAKGNYAQTYFQGQAWQAHRLSFFLECGRIPKKFVCHTCDNKACVNPEHLFEGDAQINAADRLKWEVQLTLEDLQAIRSSPVPTRILAKKWHLSPAQIEAIRPPRLYAEHARYRGNKINNKYYRDRVWFGKM